MSSLGCLGGVPFDGLGGRKVTLRSTGDWGCFLLPRSAESPAAKDTGEVRKVARDPG